MQFRGKQVVAASGAVAAAIALAACSSSSSSSSSAPASAAASTPAASATTSASASTASGTISGAGSTFQTNFQQGAISAFKSVDSGITVNYNPVGSGTGRDDLAANTVLYAGSDSPIPSKDASQFKKTVLYFPVQIGPIAIAYNVSGVTDLKLDATVLAGIFSGKITTWNDPAITALNPGVTLPSTPIVPVRRVDSSGDTFIFTSFLSATNPTWSSGPAYGTTVNWPSVSSELTANGNPAMVDTCHSTPGCIAYVGASVESTALVDGLGEVELENASGSFVQPNQTTINAAVTAGATSNGSPAVRTPMSIHNAGRC